MSSRSTSLRDRWSLWVAIAGVLATVFIGWLNLRTNERGLQALNPPAFADANDPIPLGSIFLPFKGATMILEVHNTGNVSFVLNEVRLFVKRSTLTKEEGRLRPHIADKYESCRSDDILQTDDTLFDVRNGKAGFQPVAIPRAEVVNVTLSFFKSADLPRTSKIASILTPRLAHNPVEGLLCAEFIYSSYDGKLRSVFQPLFLGIFAYDPKADTLLYERGPPFLMTRQIQTIY